MRIAGVPLEDIRERLGYRTLTAARAAITREATKHMKFSRHELEAIRDLELARLDTLQAYLWDGVTEGDTRSVDAVLKVMKHRMALLGLDASAQAAATGAQQVTNNVLVVGGDGDMTQDLREAAAQVSDIARRQVEGEVVEIDAQSA